MSELLSPAGTKEAFKAAISNGANAIYLGLDKFSARAYADNFTLENLKELLDFAHLRNVKVFVTINTIIYDDELNEVYDSLDKLAKMGVDAIIIQDLAVLNYIKSHYSSLLPHASTQMGVDDKEAASLLKDLGFTRLVFARETPIVAIKEIKEALDIEVEAFIHGALCVSYSGNCYMSSSIGERSGNRGRCAGCCRKYYSLIDLNNNNSSLGDGYLLSMKDLNESSNISDISFVDSLKIEGRMKEPNYVASVTRAYRELLDHENFDKNILNKVFNRTYTKGFMFNDTSSDITNIERPNNFGYLIGTVVKEFKKTVWIRLTKELNKGDQIRIESDNKKEEISIPVIKMFDADFKPITSTTKMAVIGCESKVKLGAKVYKTKDINFINESERTLLNNEYSKIPIDMELTCYAHKPLFLKVTYKDYKVFVKSNEIIEEALTSSATKESIQKQLEKLNDTPYKLGKLVISLDPNLFVPVKALNELRREAISKLNEQRLDFSPTLVNSSSKIVPMNHELLNKPEITIEVTNKEQYDLVKSLGINKIYFSNVVRRNNVKEYKEFVGEVLVNGYNGIHHYLNTNNTVVSDSSLNVVNHVSAGILSSLGVERVTLSQEINKDRINKLVNNYFNEFNTYPNLELIVYGRSKIMHSKYCPMKRLGMCGKCKESKYALKDDFASFPIIFNDDCTTTLLNSKTLNIMDKLCDLKGVNYYRLVFTTESLEEITRIVNHMKDVINDEQAESSFDKQNHTRGHFFSNPL